ncbi:MAG: SH3 domain-containing protein [Cyanobacteria bacterium SZAS-4]|nr:SH3 domain-containing protein [Cyanobacteria bacterium SZAS-4]
MRCPECTERNSVAARSCDACGYKFKRKPVPVTVWAGLGIVATALTFWGVASAVVPSLTDPSKSLARVAKEFLAGPKNPEHATKLKNDFDNSVKEFLVANGKDPSPELVKKLQTILASNSFEVHSFELPRGLKVVEVDTILQASDFLVMNSAAGTKVFILPDFEVFDNAQILNDHARNSLVLVGHSAGQGAHRPQVKVFALLPDDVQDETAKALPPIIGEGVAAFAPNHKDIVADLSLFSVGVAQRLFKPVQPSIGRGEEERVKQTLTWKDGAYTSNMSNGKGALAALYSVARCMQAPADSDRFANSLSPKSINFIKSNQIKLDAPNFIVGQTEAPSKQRRTPTVSRLLMGAGGNSFRVELQKSGEGADAHVVASNIKRTDETIAVTPAVKTPDVVAVTPTTASTATPSVATTTTTTLTPVQVANIDPGFNHHQATIVEKKNPTAKKEQKTDMPIEDRIINSSKNQTLIQSSKDEGVKSASPKETVKAPTKAPEQNTQISSDSKKVEIVESKAQAVKYPVDEVISPALEKTADSNINLRRGPSNGYRTLAHLKPGAKIEVIGKKDGWYKVRSGGTEGFIAMSTIDTKKSSSSSSTSSTKTETVTTSSSSKSESKSTKNSTTSTPVKTASSSTGSSSGKSSSPSSSSASKSGTSSSSSSSSKSSAPKDTTEPMQKGLTSGTLNRNRTIRDENHNPIGVASKGAKVVVLTGLKNGKYKVQLPSGKTGYVDKDTVDVVNDAPQFVP